MFASETWPLTQRQAECLEVVHNQHLQQLLHVLLSEKRRLVEIRMQCGTVSLQEHLRRLASGGLGMLCAWMRAESPMLLCSPHCME
jgi:hypothetical protein